MKHLCLAASILCVVFVFIVVISQPASATELRFSDREMIEFVSENIPDLKGRVIAADPTAVYAQVEHGKLPAAVDVLRTVIKGDPPNIEKQEVHLARAILEPAGPGIGSLKLTTQLAPHVRVGDYLRRRPVVLYLDIGARGEKIAGKILSLPQVEAVKLGSPGPEAEGTEYVLSLRPGFLELTKSSGQPVADFSLDVEVERRLRGRLLPELNRKSTFPGRMRDFVVASDTLFLFASETKLSLVKKDNGNFQTITQQQIHGEILALSLVSSASENNNSFSFLIVYRRRGVLRSAYYNYVPETYKFESSWEEQQLWIQKTGPTYQGLRIGISDPLGEKIHPLVLDENGWEWVEDAVEMPAATPPASFNLKGENMWRINRGGHLEKYFRGARIYKTEDSYGGRPFELEARQGARTATLHPPWSLIEEADQIFLLVPHNKSEGAGLFRRLRRYTQSQLFLLAERDRDLDIVWESGRLPGYISAVKTSSGQIYFIQVEQENNRTHLFLVENI